MNLEGGKYLEFNLSKERFDKLANFCKTKFPEKEWKIERQ